MTWRVMRDIAAGPHVADHICDRLAGDGAGAARQFERQFFAWKEHGAVAVVVMRQHRVIGDEGAGHADEDDGPGDCDASEPFRLDGAARHQHQPGAGKHPQRIAPHCNRTASGDGGQCQHGGDRAEGQQSDDAPVEGVGH